MNYDKMDNLKYIQLYKGSKIPTQTWKITYNKTELDFNKYNYGVLTGKINNLIVLDIDVKDEGI